MYECEKNEIINGKRMDKNWRIRIYINCKPAEKKNYRTNLRCIYNIVAEQLQEYLSS